MYHYHNHGEVFTVVINFYVIYTNLEPKWLMQKKATTEMLPKAINVYDIYQNCC